jgi:hypothetical protein
MNNFWSSGGVESRHAELPSSEPLQCAGNVRNNAASMAVRVTAGSQPATIRSKSSHPSEDTDSRSSARPARLI